MGVSAVCFAPQAHARRSLQTVHTAWEQLLGNQIVQAYFCVGILGDLYRAKIYKNTKTKRYAQTIFALLGQKKLFLMSIRKQGGSSHRALFRQYLATTDMLLLASRRLQKLAAGEEGVTITQFLTYRNAAAQSVNKLLSNPARKRKRYYSGGWRKAVAHLGAQLGPGMAFGYLAIGLLADSYFQQVLTKEGIAGYLGPSLQLLQASAIHIQRIIPMLNPNDQEYAKQIYQGTATIYQQGTALGLFIRTRQRGYLKQYNQQRTAAWSLLQPLAAP